MRNAILLFMLLTAITTIGAEDAKPVRGTHVIVTPPPGFTPTDRFPGYLSEATGSSITVTELPGLVTEPRSSFEDVAKGFAADALRKKGMTLLTKEDASYGTHKGILISVAQTAFGVDYLKWIAVFGDGKTTYLIGAVFPKESEGDLSDTLKKAVLGARVNTADVDPFDAVTFRISPTSDMKIAKVIANNIILSKGGVFPAKSVETPVFIAATSVSKGLEISNKKTFAETRMRSITALKDIQPGTTEPIAIDGLDGLETVGDATDTDSEAKVVVYQVILFDADGYYLMQGFAAAEAAKTQLPTFKQIAKSFTRVKTPP